MSEVVVSYRIPFQVPRQADWPDAMPWPEWKPETDKSYFPSLMFFSIEWDSASPVRVSLPSCLSVTGPRILSNGKHGSDVHCVYYGRDKLPEPLRGYVDEMLAVARIYAYDVAGVPMPFSLRPPLTEE